MSIDKVSSHTITLWKVWLPDFERFEAFYFSLLNDQEKEEIQSFRTRELQRLHTLSQGILREVLASYLSIPPREVAFSYGLYKKPHLAGSPKNLEFSMSHSYNMLLIGTSIGAPIGVDVEKFHRRPEESLEESFFSKKELEEYEKLPEVQQAEALFAALTHKEALRKLNGSGSSKNLQSVEVPLQLLEQPVVVLYERSQESLQSFILDDDYIVAIASPRRNFKMQMREFRPREALMKAHPFFESFTDKDITELAKLATEKRYSAGQVIVKEGELVDSVYLIYDGDIELSIEGIPRRVMQVGEAIGLTATGFYSETGMRTATLKAINDVEVLAFNLKALHRFLERHAEFMKTMAPRAEKMLRAGFIRKVIPFSPLPSQAVLNLAENIEELRVASGTMMFKQGDHATTAYLIVDGEVQILLNDEKGNPRPIATMLPGQLFGEAAVLGSPNRGASALASKDCTLFVLSIEQLDSLLHYSSSSDAIRGLMMQHWRPRQIERVEFYGRKTEEGLEVVVLKDKTRGRYHQLSKEGWLVWEQLNGQRTLKELTRDLSGAHSSLAPDAIVKIVRGLAYAGFVNLPRLKATADGEASSGWKRILQKIKGWFR